METQDILCLLVFIGYVLFTIKEQVLTAMAILCTAMLVAQSTNKVLMEKDAEVVQLEGAESMEALPISSIRTKPLQLDLEEDSNNIKKKSRLSDDNMLEDDFPPQTDSGIASAHPSPPEDVEKTKQLKQKQDEIKEGVSIIDFDTSIIIPAQLYDNLDNDPTDIWLIEYTEADQSKNDQFVIPNNDLPIDDDFTFNNGIQETSMTPINSHFVITQK